ncbi:TetR/AcrR family transcriptional regulator [Pseudonocardia sp. CA-142604]|uniref:TetR/AcrR family transcriptional regulator n=1 Tax=Pseudonocardia sp. CA-142604 TaxID=3240024 RepID=UPI003D8D33DA
MARTKAFDPDDVLERAMQTFWSYGYERATTPILERELGINRSSLYGTFGSKAGLYRRALERYSRTLPGPGGFGEPESGTSNVRPLREQVMELLWQVAEPDLDADRPRGCFAGNATVEVAAHDVEVQRLVSGSFGGVRKRLRDLLLMAQTQGALDADADTDALASMLLVVTEGLSLVARATRDRELVGQAIRGAVAAL